jgi:hypothetical protein
MGITQLFKLSKLTIKAFSDEARSKSIGSPVKVQYNPESLAIKHESVFQSRQGIATSSAQARFSHGKSRQVDVDLVFEGTRVGYMGVELLGRVDTVADRVDAFLKCCYQVKSSTHEPAFLKLVWDKGIFGRAGFDCRLESVDIQYTAFERDGSPLRADLKAKFVEDLDPKKKASQDRLSSPDLSHRRIVCTGDTLPGLCIEIYGAAEHYLRVAEINAIDDFRSLRPGQELIFPPFERAPRSQP